MAQSCQFSYADAEAEGSEVQSQLTMKKKGLRIQSSGRALAWQVPKSSQSPPCCVEVKPQKKECQASPEICVIPSHKPPARPLNPRTLKGLSVRSFLVEAHTSKGRSKPSLEPAHNLAIGIPARNNLVCSNRGISIAVLWAQPSLSQKFLGCSPNPTASKK